MLNLRQAAEKLGYSTSGLRKLVNRGAIRHFQPGPRARIKFRVEWVEEFINSKSKAGA